MAVEHPRTGVVAGLKSDHKPTEGREDRGIAPRGVVELEMGTVNGRVKDDGTTGVDEWVGDETGTAED